MNNTILTVLFFFSIIGTAFGQQVQTMTSDMVLTETLVITESTTYVGNGNKNICNDCNPMIKVVGDIEVRFENVVFEKGYQRWITNQGGAVYWTGGRMNGYIIWSEEQE